MDNTSSIYHTNLKEDIGKPIPSPQFESLSPTTMFGQKFGMFIMDKVHTACKHNVLHMAGHALQLNSLMIVVMTVTPVTTKPQMSNGCASLFSVI